jgi:hypothetical protein
MGCDYYTWIETVIQYTDSSNNPNEYIEKPECDNYEKNYDYSCYSAHTYDPDFDDPPEHPLYRDIRMYGQKDMYTNNTWVCKPHGKSSVEAICEEQHIPIDKLTRVFKRKNGYIR